MGRTTGARKRATTIASEAELLQALGCTSDYTLDDWIKNRCEFADDVDDELADDPETSFRRMLLFYGNGVSGQYDIYLNYPFLLSAFTEQVDRAELYFRGVIHASSAREYDTLGVLDGDDDMSADLAHVLGNVDVQELADVLGGEWQRMDLGVDADVNGEPIYGWYVPSDERMLALGISPQALFVLELHGDDEQGYTVEETWPEAAVQAWWVPDWAAGQPTQDPDGSLDDLASALTLAGTPARTGGVSNDHTVRLSTRNLLLAGIDLDFEVKKGGRRLGTLSVSEGGLLWRPAGSHRRKGRAKAGIKVSWAQFARWAES
jgi:hypothetical protein